MELFTRTHGSGPHTIVFLHGVFGQGRNWTQIAHGLEDAATCVLVDAPNHGHSPWTDATDYPTVSRIVADDLARLGLVGPDVTLLGHSMGAKIVMTIALDRPDTLGRLVVVDNSPRAKRVSNTEPLIAAMRSLDLDALIDRRDAEAEMARMVPDRQVAGFLLQNLRHERDETGVRRWRWAMNLDRLGDGIDDIGDWPAPPEGTTFDGPTLWIAGARSDYITDEDTAAMRALFPAMRKVVVKDAGHWVHADQPQVMIELLRQFVLG